MTDPLMNNFACISSGNGDIRKNIFIYFDHSVNINHLVRVFQETVDCSLWYKTDLTFHEAMENIECTKRILLKMDVFSIALTSSLLCAKDKELQILMEFANKNYIPILPIVFEEAALEDYELDSVFQNMHYISCIKYNALFRRGLKNYFDKVILDEPQRKIIRQSFASEIFLSYRRVNRQLADELIEKIHGYRLFRRVIIWNDFFLTPGGLFSDEIKKHIIDSKMCLLIITSDLFDNPQNYVVQEEYPFMVQQGKTIIGLIDPIVDINLAKSAFPQINKFYNLEGQSTRYTGLSHEFGELLENIFGKIVYDGYFPLNSWENMGIAYLNGIFVERNPHLGVRMIEDTLGFRDLEIGIENLKTIKLLHRYTRNIYINNEHFIVVSELYRYALDDLARIKLTEENAELYYELALDFFIGRFNALIEEGFDQEAVDELGSFFLKMNPVLYRGEYRNELLNAYNHLNISWALIGSEDKVLSSLEITSKLLMLQYDNNGLILGFDIFYMYFIFAERVKSSFLMKFLFARLKSLFERLLSSLQADYEKAIILLLQGLLLASYDKKHKKAYRKFKESYSFFKKVPVNCRDSEYYHQMSVLLYNIAKTVYVWQKDTAKALKMVKKAKQYNMFSREMCDDMKYYVFYCFIEYFENSILLFDSKPKLVKLYERFNILHNKYPNNATFSIIVLELKNRIKNEI